MPNCMIGPPPAHSPAAKDPEPDPPICVDLDGTLIRTDLLYESLCLLIRQKPASLVMLPIWLARGRAHLKARLAERVVPEADTLPYVEEVVAYVRQARADGKRTALVTAAHSRHAHAVANHLGVFDRVIASDGRTNLKGKRKVEAIRREFGEAPFDYMGDSRADLSVWHEARRAFLVHPSEALVGKVRRTGKPLHVFEGPGGSFKSYVRMLRPHQWTKNLLLFVPLMTAHLWGDPRALASIALAMAIFCLTASAVYIVNDLLDLSADRRHRSKRSRPLAAGIVPIPHAAGIAAGSLALALAGAWFLPPAFAACLVLYILLTTAYSVHIKKKAIVDVICLAGLYTLRIISGGAASSVTISPWLLAFSMFFFLSLAFVKRYSELIAKAGLSPSTPIEGRGYTPIDLELIQSIGPAMGGLSVLVMCLYINSPDVLKLYRHPQILWLICPILLYWIIRVWLLARRELLHDDPIVFALRDRVSYLSGLLVVAVLLLGI
jgi:4-hydroxybenzoate polyprenyltransferase/phosphoserine phosphatase